MASADNHQQALLQTLLTGSVPEKTDALKACVDYISDNIHFFAINFLPVILPLASQESDANLRIQLLQVIEKVCSVLSSGSQEVRYPVIAGCIEAVAVMFADETISVRKRLILTLTNMYPEAFRILCVTPGDSKYWQILSILKTQIDGFFVHENEGIRINAARYLSKVAIMQAPPDVTDNDTIASLSLIPADHPYMNNQQLVAESVTLLDKFLTLLRAHAQIQATGLFTSAIINCLHDIIISRKQYAQAALKVLLEFFKQQRPSHLTSFQYKSVRRTLKVVFLSVFTIASLEPIQPEIIEALEQIGAKPYEIQGRLRRAMKRSIPADFDDEIEDWKRARFAVHGTTEPSYEQRAAFAANILLVGIEKVPLMDVIETIIQVVGTRTTEQFEQDIQMHLENEAIRTEKEKAAQTAVVQDPRLRAAAMQAATQPVVPKVDPVAEALARQIQQDTSNLMAEIQVCIQLHQQQLQVQAVTQTQAGIPGFKEETDLNHAGGIDATMKAGAAIGSGSALALETFVSAEERSELVVETLERIFAMESHFSIPTAAGAKLPALIPRDNNSILAARLGWIVMTIRVVTRSSMQADRLRQKLLDFILADFKKRVNIAILWLHEEQFLSQSGNTDSYTIWLKNILDGLARDRESRNGSTGTLQNPTSDRIDTSVRDNQFEKLHAALDPEDRAFVRLLIESPVFTDIAMDHILACCESSNNIYLGVSALRELINSRPAVRDNCLEKLLAYCITPDPQLRSTSIIITRQLFENHKPLSATISSFSLKQLALLKSIPEVPVQEADHKVEDSDQAKTNTLENESAIDTSLVSQKKISAEEHKVWMVQEVARHLELYLALCSCKDALLDEVCLQLHEFPAYIQEIVSLQLVGLLRAMSVHPEKLLSLISTFPDGAEVISIKAIEVLLTTEHAALAIKQAIDAYMQRQLDARFLVIIMPHLERAQIMSELPKLIMTLDGTEKNHNIVCGVVTQLISADNSLADGEVKKAPLTPAELLIKIHQIDDIVGLKRCVEATSICFEMPDLFKQEVLAVTLQHLADLPTLPILFMRTAIQSLGAYKGLVSFVNNILGRLVGKRIWANTQVWQGFIRCCTIMFPSSISIILALPKTQALDLIDKSPNLRHALQEYLGQLSTQQRARRDFVVLGQLLNEITAK
ncbi:hypothetical protein RTP6_007225 [Batrachochytrium dendrobatidis]